MILNIKSLTELSGFYVIFNRTSINEYEGIYGISHLVEHLISDNFKENAINDFQNHGISWNAYTSPTNLVFFMTGLDKYVSRYRDMFLDSVLQLNMTDETFLNEKSVLLEEYTSLFNIQTSSHLLNLYRKFFNSYNSIGKKDDIIKITKKDCYDYQKKYYTYPSKIINISKSSPFVKDMKFNDFKNDFHLSYIKNNKCVIEHHDTHLNKSSIIYLSKVIEEDWANVFFINYLLSNTTFSPLYKNVRKDKGLAYYIKCSLDRMSDFSGINIISTETDDYKVEKLMDILNSTLSDISFLTRDKFDIIKSSIKNKIETVTINRHTNVDTYIKPESWSIEKQIDNITYDNIVETYLKYYKVEDFYKSIDKKEFLKK